MEKKRIQSLYQHILDFHNNENLGEGEIDLKGLLKPTLRKYQERAVKWMLKRECEEQTVHLNGVDVVLPNGGILADEMGLGKTVEVLACLLSNSCEFQEPELRKVSSKTRKEVLHILSDDSDDEYDVPLKKKRRPKVDPPKPAGKKRRGLAPGVAYSLLKKQYESILSEMSCSRSANGSSNSVENPIQCFCDSNESDRKKLVQCEVCGVWQHAECLGIENGHCFGAVKCTKCWAKSPQIPSKATLIITPPSILNQWIQEIEKHVNSSDFQFYVYQGVKSRNYIQPSTLAVYDVVLTTYNVLCSELYFVGGGEPSRPLRHAKKYFSPSSPLVCLNWWRLCLDEAQMVEGFTTKTAVMAAQLDSKYRWAVTGTPIQKSLNDLYGLAFFLRLQGLDTDWSWNEVEFNSSTLHGLFQELMWRNSKSAVYDELGVPPQTVLTHWLHLSPVEGHFYKTIHLESAVAFREKLAKFDDINIKISEVDKRSLTRLMLPLLGVRQACTHPQVVRGRFVKAKHTITMEELMTHMIYKAKLEAENALRGCVASYHGLAGLHIIQGEWSEAVENYRAVLHLRATYQGTLKIDTLQMIHCLHNLSFVLENHSAGIPPTLRDSELKAEALKLENNYLQKYEQKLLQTRGTLAKCSAAIGGLCQGRTLGFTDWWEETILASDSDDSDLLGRISTYLDDNLVPGQQDISKKLTNLRSVHREVALWLANADSLRQEALAALRGLELLPTADLIQSAFNCHINNERKRKRKNGVGACNICTTEEILKKYEVHIFPVNKGQEGKRRKPRGEGGGDFLEEEDAASEEEEAEAAAGGDGGGGDTSGGKEGKELKSANIYKTKKESNWKPSSHERIIHVLCSAARRLSSRLGEEGGQHLTILENVRKEFKWIRAVWRLISDQVYATDELHMAKLRLRLPLYEGESGKNDIFIIEEHDVPYTQIQLKSDLSQSDSLLKRTTGTLLYLTNLQKNGTVMQECPICQETLTTKWSVLGCGHCCCYDCIPTLLKMSGTSIDCPLCRLKTPRDQISYVQAQKSGSPEDGFSQVIGDHSTKVTAVVSQLQSILKDDPSVKILVFSTWEKVLNIIRDALIQNKISFRQLECGGDKFKTNLAQFKNGNISVLLLPLKHGSKGLNLTEATHLFFVEPILNPAEELQAVGRIHRIGQTKPTWVHRFVVRNSIEERMLSSLEAGSGDSGSCSGSRKSDDSAEGWSQENVTLAQLNDLFSLNEEAPTAGTS